MTAIRDGHRIYTFEEWKKLPEVHKAIAELDTCDVCQGDAFHSCDCGDMHTCRECGGSGVSKDIRDLYENALRREIEYLAAWVQGIHFSDRLPPPNPFEIPDPYAEYDRVYIQLHIP